MNLRPNLQTFADVFFSPDRCQVTNSGTMKSLGGGGGVQIHSLRSHMRTHIAPTWEPRSTRFILGNLTSLDKCGRAELVSGLRAEGV